MVKFTFTFTYVLLRRVTGIDGGVGDAAAAAANDDDEVTGIDLV